MHDTVIIGAGLAGISAAGILAKAGRSFIILEARDRIGGRVFPVFSDHTAFPIELGAEWIEAKGRVADLLKQEGVQPVEAEGKFLQRTDQGWEDIGKIFDRTMHLAKELHRKSTTDRSLAQAIQEGELAQRSVEMLLYYTGSFHAADPE